MAMNTKMLYGFSVENGSKMVINNARYPFMHITNGVRLKCQNRLLCSREMTNHVHVQ